jgi:hypothetical protein
VNEPFIFLFAMVFLRASIMWRDKAILSTHASILSGVNCSFQDNEYRSQQIKQKKAGRHLYGSPALT